MHGLKCIIVQECYDNDKVGQPEILEKQRICEAYGAEVVQLTVGPELFTTHLSLLEDTGYFNASLYTPFGIAGVETLGYEIAEQCKERFGKYPDAVLCTDAGGGNLTGTARGVKMAGAADTKIIGACIFSERRSLSSPVTIIDTTLSLPLPLGAVLAAATIWSATRIMALFSASSMC